VDRIGSINTDVSVSGLKPGTNFLFARYNDGSPVFGASPYPPIYDMTAPSVLTRQGAILAQFEGANGAASYTGVSGETWTFSAANASISTAQYKAGVSSVRIAGTNGYVQCPAPTLGAGPWTMEMFVRMDDATPAADQILISNDIHYVTQILVNTAGKLQVFLGSNGTSYNIANGTQSAAAIFADAAWHHFAAVYTGEAYKFYVDGTEVLSIASVLPLYQPGAIRLGIGPSSGSPFIGYFDDFRFSPFARYTVSFTPPASLTPDDVYFFDISAMRMYRGYPGSWTADNVLFLGEAEVGGDGLVDSVISYALGGFWDSGEFAVTARTIYNKNHFIGTDWLFLTGWIWAVSREKKRLVNNYHYRTDNAHGHGDVVWVSSRLTVHQYIGQWLFMATLDGSLPETGGTGTVRLFARRAF
jgi:hypothetical protein